jgi:NAD-dependent deacetylase
MNKVFIDSSTVAFPPDLITRLRAAPRVTVLTGAGISAESGVPTFREAQTGLWEKFRPEELATPEAFQRNPKMVWEWYEWRRQRVRTVAPNPGHLALADLQRRVPEFFLITQNVDGLHQRAGSQRVIELHGNINRTKCFEEDQVVEKWEETGEVPPRCPRCGGKLRPDVVWFGEMLPPEAMAAA